jgi:hypothetical protein
MPQMNPDGTVQVAPPTTSAFAPQVGQPPPPQQAAPGATAAPGAAGAIQALIAALAQAFAPKGITQHAAALKQQEAASSGDPTLGDQFPK